METAILAFCAIGVFGIGAQWVAWRWGIPAIVVMLAAGLIIGPVTGVVDPRAVMGDIFDPVVSMAVAIILFEGGLTLNFRKLLDGDVAVRRLVYLGGPLVFILTALAAFYVGGLPYEMALVLGGILVVTGPTVIIPLLRQASLKRRPAEVLRWEGIVNDPIGALIAVLAFEIVAITSSDHAMGMTIINTLGGLALAVICAFVAYKGIVYSFTHGLVPEYLKVPVLIVAVMIVFALPNYVLHDAGLLSVTVMGVLIGNSEISSLDEMRRFKENITVLLVSGVFIMLAADFDLALVLSLDLRMIAFILLVVFVIRLVSMMTVLLGTNLPKAERFIIGWIGPRGVVAVAVAGVFVGKLEEIGVENAQMMTAIVFSIVGLTVVFHGFSLDPLARAMKLRATSAKGVLIIGGNPFSQELAAALRDLDRPSLVVDRNWSRLRALRQASIETYYGEILSEEFEIDVDLNRFGTLFALTDNDDYNALVTSDYAPEFGHNHVWQFSSTRRSSGDSADNAANQIGGHYFGDKLDFHEAQAKMRASWRVRRTNLSENFSGDDYLEEHDDSLPVLIITDRGDIRPLKDRTEIEGVTAGTVLALGPERSAEARLDRREAAAD